jgi:hypothetical protein
MLHGRELRSCFADQRHEVAIIPGGRGAVAGEFGRSRRTG